MGTWTPILGTMPLFDWIALMHQIFNDHIYSVSPAAAAGPMPQH